MAARRRGGDESVYDLIPRAAPEVVKPAMHRSMYPADTPPTSSTFGRSHAAQIAVTNVAGDYVDMPRVHRHKLEGANFGPGTEHFSDPTTFLQKQSAPPLEQPRGFDRGIPQRKAPVVRRGDKPLMGLASGKNFIRENAVAAITTETKRATSREVNFLEKPGFGQTPAYLTKVKAEIAGEREYIRSVMEAEREEEMKSQPKMRLLPEEERVALLEGLKKKWEAVNKQYQTCTHIVTLDTIGKVRRKEQYEQQLQQLERSIDKLSKKFVFVGEDSY